MGLRILNAGPGPEELCQKLEAAIREALPEAAEIAVRAGGAGHFSVAVRAAAFAGKTRVAQHQMVYRALAPFMSGPDAPVHAIDSLDCATP